MLRLGHDLHRVSIERLRLATTALIGVLAAFWFYLSSASVSASLESGSVSTPVLVATGLASAINLVALVLAGVASYYIPRGRALYFRFVIVVLAANAFASVFDQFGVVDAFYLTGVLAAMGLTLALRRRCARRPRGAPAP